MSAQSPIELLETLRANLRHFEESIELGDIHAVADIRLKLLRRIADVERIVKLAANRSS